MEINKRENIGWIDLLRVTACFLVVFAHCCDPFVARFDTDRPTFCKGAHWEVPYAVACPCL